MGRIVRMLGIVVVGSVAAIWYVLANGIDADYRPLGAAGPLLPGRQIVLIAAAGLLGLICVLSGLVRRSITSILAGVLLVVCAGSMLSNAAQSVDTAGVSDGLAAAAACRHILEENPDLASRLLKGTDHPVDIVADAARAHDWSEADRECLAEAGTWALRNAR